MCNPASFIVTRERALFCPTDSHEDIIKHHKLDDGIRGDFVRVELSPPNGRFDLPVSDWIFNTDQDDVPDWYSWEWARAICEMEIDAWWVDRVINHGGSLYLSGTQVTALPEGLTLGGSLDLRGTQVTALPEGLTVGGSLDLSGTQVTALPEGLTVGGYLDLCGTQVKSLPKHLDTKVIR